jgi:hypothetical protein
MTWIDAILKTIWDLFIDDGAFALSILIWLALVWLLRELGFNATWDCGLLFVGLAVLLVHSARRKTANR